MSDSLKHKIFTETDCISEQTMFNYIDKKLSAKECHVVEKHLLHCDLCSDALEGLELVKNRNRVSVINQQVNQRINESVAVAAKETKVVSFNYKLVLSIAASVLLLIGGVFFFNQMNKKSELAENKSVPTEITPPPPPPPAPSTMLESEPAKEAESGVSSVVTADDKTVAKPRSEVVSTKNAEQQERLMDVRREQPLVQSQTNKATGAGQVSTSSTLADEDLVAVEEEKDYKAPAAKSGNATVAKPQEVAYGESAKAEKKSENFNAYLGNLRKDEAKQEESTAPLASTTAAPTGGKADDGVMDKTSEKKVETVGANRTMATLSDNKKISKARAKEKSADVDEEIVYASKSAEEGDVANAKIVEQVIGTQETPEFPGGSDSLTKYINDNFKYPENYNVLGFSGKKIYVNFLVGKDGKIVKAKVIKGVNASLDEEALRVVNNMPKWKPVKIKGKYIVYNYNLPIKLK
jgi:hypothetical protein